jgi:hypothetical protein
MVVVDDEVDEIDYNKDLVDRDELVLTLKFQIKIIHLIDKRILTYLMATLAVDSLILEHPLVSKV